jgi:two-component system invasion response regulator UvrY
MHILIADDNATLRSRLRELLTESFPSAQISEAVDTCEVMSQLALVPSDVLLLDINMPGRTGLQVLDELKIQYPQTRVIVLSLHPETQYAVRALRAGARAYLDKDNVADDLVRTVKAVLKARQYAISDGRAAAAVV